MTDPAAAVRPDPADRACWLAADHTTRINHTDPDPDDAGGVRPVRTIRVAHLLRWGHTLCGRRPSLPGWSVPDAATRRCQFCAAIPDGHYTARDLQAATGLTYRQVDHWTRQGLLHAHHTRGAGHGGIRRTYPPDQMAAARVMAPLVAAGLTPTAALHVAHTGQLAPGIHIHIEHHQPGEAAS